MKLSFLPLQVWLLMSILITAFAGYCFAAPQAYALRPHNTNLPVQSTSSSQPVAMPMPPSTSSVNPAAAGSGNEEYKFTPLVKSLPPAAGAAVASNAKNPLPVIQALEDSLYDARYDDESLDARLSRIEITVFGKASNGQPVEKRLSRLGDILASQKPLAPASDAAGSGALSRVSSGGGAAKKPVNPSAPSQTVVASPRPAAGENDYPAVGLMERKLFNRSYEQEDITVRLNRLDGQVFHAPQTGELADRVDRLRDVVLGDNPNSDESPLAGANTPRDTFPSSGANGYPYHAPPQQWTPPSSTDNSGRGSGFPGGSYPAPAGGDYSSGGNAAENAPDLNAAVTQIEKQVLGHTYPAEPLNTRLDRLEQKVFKATSPDLPASDRVQRIVAVASAGGAPSSPHEKAKRGFYTMLPIILMILPLVLL
jgi:hypothetical protein